MSRKPVYTRGRRLLLPIALLLINPAIHACSIQAAASSQVSSSGIDPSLQSEMPQEGVVINSQTYPIPPPWAGNEIAAPEYDYEDFRQIPVEYTHQGSKLYILAAAHQPLVKMLQAAAEDGIMLEVESAYRSERYQKRIFKRMLDEGRTFADIVRYVAPPGYSQHVLGTAVDFFPSNWSFAETRAYEWLGENAHRFGFTESYSRLNREKIPWEAWHWNYIGSGDEQFALPRLEPSENRKKAPSDSSD